MVTWPSGDAVLPAPRVLPLPPLRVLPLPLPDADARPGRLLDPRRDIAGWLSSFLRLVGPSGCLNEFSADRRSDAFTSKCKEFYDCCTFRMYLTKRFWILSVEER